MKKFGNWVICKNCGEEFLLPQDSKGYVVIQADGTEVKHNWKCPFCKEEVKES